MRWFREDIHIHATPADIHRRIAQLETAGQWLPPAFSAVGVRDQHLELTLELPGRREAAALAIRRREAPVVLELGPRDGRDSALECTFLVNAEGPTESHVIVEVHYDGAGGLLGPLLDVAMHRSHRRQAFRDALWQLKQAIEQPTTQAPARTGDHPA